MLTIIFLLATIGLGAAEISITNITAPPYAELHGSMVLDCKYHLENNDRLYALKWYIGLQEFYRFTPSDQFSPIAFSTDFFYVNLDASSGGQVHIHNMTREAAGVYRCEVIGEYPAFYAAAMDVHVRIMELPTTPPSLQVVDNLIECQIGPSTPPADLTFSLNGDTVPSSYLAGEPMRNTTKAGLTATSIKLSQQALHFYGNGSVVTCTATVLESFRQMVDKRIVKGNAGVQLMEYDQKDDEMVMISANKIRALQQIQQLFCSLF